MTATLADISNGIKRSNDTLEETLKSQQAMTSSQDRLITVSYTHLRAHET